MRHSSDSWGDMRDEHPLDDPLLTDFFTELRSWGSGPAPEPLPALATLLAAADHMEHATPREPVPTPRRKNMIAAKLAGLGVFAKAALGVGIAAAAVTTAGATDVLPAPAQHAVAVAVNAISPLELPDDARVRVAADDAADLDVDVTAPTTTVPVPGTDDPADDPADDGDETATDNHGACVSAVAQDKGLTGREHGQAVSAIAKSDCGKEDAATSTTLPSTTTSTTVAGDDDNEATANNGPSANSGPGNSGNQGNGGGGGKGKGSGKSGSGS